MTPLIIIGAGGFGREVLAYAKDAMNAGWGPYDIKGFLDDTKNAGDKHCGLPVLGNTQSPVDPDAIYLIAIGTPEARKAISERFSESGATFATLLHPAAYVAETATVEAGAIMAPFSFVGPDGKLGRQTLLNIYSSIAHESTLGDYSVMAPYAGTHANAKVGDTCFIGAHSTITRFITLGNNVKVAAGSVVYTNAPDEAEAIGNPARFR